mmetsp:Transcript_33828/g.49533  ORF Transcript_33828/g.49533 Transcript_33828/m.49533 type:complete len:80 (-) Transcript_33828:8-247(-)
MFPLPPELVAHIVKLRSLSFLNSFPRDLNTHNARPWLYAPPPSFESQLGPTSKRAGSGSDMGQLRIGLVVHKLSGLLSV